MTSIVDELPNHIRRSFAPKLDMSKEELDSHMELAGPSVGIPMVAQAIRKRKMEAVADAIGTQG